MQLKNKLKAFTFAELMMTMTILGIVLALVVPGLMRNSQRTEMESLIKKTHTVINQALDRALADPIRGIPEDMTKWDFSSNDTFMNTYLLPFLAVQKTCPTGDTGCFANDYRGLDATGSNDISAFAVSYLLNDGVAIQVHGCNGNQCDVHVDLNGPKEPNVMGMDYWEFTINKASAQLKPNNEGGDYSTQDLAEHNWKITRW